MRRFGRKHIKNVILAILAFVLLATPVLAAIFEADMLIQEIAGTTYNMMGIRVPANVTWWAANGYITADGRDSRVAIGSVPQPHMLQDDNVYFADGISANSTATYQVQTGEVLQDMYVVPGYDGYFSVLRDAAMEPVGDFEFEYDGWVDTSIGLGKYLIWKLGAYAMYISGATDITSAFLNAEAQHQNSAGGVAWQQTWGDIWFAQTFTPANTHHLTAIEINGTIAGNPVGMATISIRETVGGLPTGDDLTSVTFVANSWIGGGWKAYDFDIPVLVTAATTYAVVFSVPYGDGANNLQWRDDNTNPYAGGQRCDSVDGGVSWAGVAGSDFLFRERGCTEALTVAANGITTDEHNVVTIADTAGTNLFTITVDTVLEGSVGLGGATVLNNGNDWYFMLGNVSPYLTRYVHDVTGVEIARYAPNDIIVGTVLPDRTGAAQNGTLAFGNNPSGVLVSMDSFNIVDQPIAAGIVIVSPDSVDIMTAPTNMILTDAEMQMQGNEFYYFVEWLNGVSGIEIVMLWWYTAALISIAGMCVTQKYLRNVWVSGFTAAGIGWFVVSMSGLEWWMPVPIVLATLFVGLWKRSAEV